ncbi:MAG: sporulation peptidase YabG [Candidatus Syntrophonatronum acetioxidans]|uniref:Sporulation peptidase YabG n=1 Tax=Candidatus Syntrophonatronum acetioxidans TaxID=1795816 RepID=A0A424YCA5_9FIRM|nr:MAG: sporulation peptidase YabG [Candidatus Syntrophonatronum acetioxidans]
MEFKKGDIVSRYSYNNDVLFKIVEIDNKMEKAVLKGIHVRLAADAPLKDLKKVTERELNLIREQYAKKSRQCINKIFKQRTMNRRNLRNPSKSRESFFELPGKVLHLEGDEDYLDECLKAYKNLNIEVKGLFVPEKRQPEVVEELLIKIRPDILILTGHDAYIPGKEFLKVSSYRNSKYFIRATEIARKYEPGKDSLVIIAGACQSYYDKLLWAGANYAASPQRVLIHCLDPVFICEKIAYTSINETVDIKEAVSNTITGLEGMGGVETRGTFRLGLPKSPY